MCSTLENKLLWNLKMNENQLTACKIIDPALTLLWEFKNYEPEFIKSAFLYLNLEDSLHLFTTQNGVLYELTQS